MRITVSLLPAHRWPDDVIPAQTTAIVVDVLRATSVMATVAAHGAAEVVVFETIEAAAAWSAEQQRLGVRPLLCGERHCQPIAGFDGGNSPAEYPPARVAGRSLGITTTNGTRAIASVETFQHVLTAAFLNLSHVVSALHGRAHVHIVCAGTNGRVTGEDTLLAGALADRCQRGYGAVLANDEARLAVAAWRPLTNDAGDVSESSIGAALRESQGGRNLLALGFGDDIARCAALDSAPAVPRVVRRQPTTFQAD